MQSHLFHSRTPDTAMERRDVSQMTLVVTTTPFRTHGLDELNAALQRGWRVVHLAVLSYSEPGTDECWPEGHYSTLLLLHGSRSTATENGMSPSHNSASSCYAGHDQPTIDPGLPPNDLPRADYAFLGVGRE